MNKYFNNIKKNFGFGCMRFPMIGNEVDIRETMRMIDSFIKEGFNYFDTAHGYLNGKSEVVLKECLTNRYKREEYILTNKLSSSNFKTEDKLTAHFFNKEEDLESLFQNQLKSCGVEYFDFYLMHAQNASLYEKFKKCKAYEFALNKKQTGEIKHFGISFHDTADVLEKILIEYPQIEVVQLQFNYLDYDDAAVQSKKCYEVCQKYNRPVIVMEPVKGGSLVDLPKEADGILQSLNGGSNASYAIRFAGSFEGVMMVLSGMSNMEQLQDNVSFMRNFKPLTNEEFKAVYKVAAIFKSKKLISCTSCRYCIDQCPKKISIPDLFACMNAKKIFNDWNSSYYYNEVHAKNRSRASDCIKCGKCEAICPQHLKIRDLLNDVRKEFENN